MTRRHLRLLCCTLALLGGSVFEAAAQEKPREEPRREREPADPLSTARRPYEALFGAAVVEDEPANGLHLTGSLFESWDENLLADFTGPNTTSTLQVSGVYTNVLGDLNYSRRSDRLQVAANAGGNARYYTSINAFAANDYHGGIGVAVRPSNLLTVTANQSVTYAPVFLFGLFADVLPTPLGSAATTDSAFAVNDDRAVTSDSRLDVERRLTSRSLLSARASYLHSHFTVLTPRGSDFSATEAGADYRYRLTRDADLRIGYAYRQGNFMGTEPFGLRPQQPAEHNLRFGVAFHPALSEQRRTVLTFDAGTAFVTSALATDAFQSRRQLRLVGEAAVAHQMGETWLTVASARRGSGFIQGLGAPVFTDAVSLATSGFFNRRTDFQASVGYANGEPSLVGAALNFSTLTAATRLRVAVSQRLAFVTEYVFYHYDFTEVLGLVPGLDPRVKRNTARVGLTFWLPVNR